MDQLNKSERAAEELFPKKPTMVSLVFNDTAVGRIQKPITQNSPLKLTPQQMAEMFPATPKMVSAVFKTVERSVPQPPISQIKTFSESEDTGPIV